MKKEKRDALILNIIGIIFLAWGLLAIIYSLATEPSKVLWFSYSGLVIIGIGILKRNSFIMMTQFNILFLLVALWSLDFFSFLLFKRFPIGVSIPFFTNATLIAKIISMEHIILIPLGSYALYKIKIPKNHSKTLLISIIQVVIVFILSTYLTDPAVNVNCVFETCLPFDFPFPQFISWSLILIPNVLINYFLIINIPWLKPKNKVNDYEGEDRKGSK